MEVRFFLCDFHMIFVRMHELRASVHTWKMTLFESMYILQIGNSSLHIFPYEFMQRPISCGLYPFTLQILSLNFTLQFLSSNISSFPLLTYRISRPGRAGPSRNWTRLERGGATSEFKYLISRNKTPMVTGNSPLLLEKNPAAKPRENFFFWYLGGKSHKIWIQKS